MKRETLREIVATVLDCQVEQLTNSAVLQEIENYDSVNILSLMVALDDEAGIKLDHTDLNKLVRYSDLEAIVQSKGVTLE